MTSVERVQEYADVSPEPDVSPEEPPKTWPEHGVIHFEGLSLKYDADQVLKNLTFCIGSKEKIGVVGRTGAGKSSIIAALFR